MDDLFGSVTADNVKRIRQQNSRRISVIIGNPPYNANQLNENENNKNREYPEVDKRIRATYVKSSDSHKTKTYDMYARFIRWASDRLDKDGILTFVTNRSYIEKQAFDGFRKSIAAEFAELYVVDLGGDARDETSVSTGNVFGIKVGVAIGFFIKKGEKQASRIHYADLSAGTREEKLSFLSSTSFEQIKFTELKADASGDWLTVDRTDFAKHLPTLIPKLSGKKRARDRQSIFELGSFGCVSNRDDWVYDFDANNLKKKLRFYSKVYNNVVGGLPAKLPRDWEEGLDYRIKWTQDLRRRAKQRELLTPSSINIVDALYRPFVKKRYCYSPEFNWSLYRMPFAYPSGAGKNLTIFFSDRGARAPFSVLATDRVAELHLCASTDGFQSFSLYRYENDRRVDNITNWALEQFRKQYPSLNKHQPITRKDIFHYIYAVLHDPLS